MAKYVIRSKVDKTGTEEKTSYYGVPVTFGQITVDYMAKEASEQSSLTEEDFMAAISILGRLMCKHLASGSTVYVKDIGLFTVSATSEKSNTPEGCTPAKVKAKRVCYKADKRMKLILPEIKYELAKKDKKKE